MEHGLNSVAYHSSMITAAPDATNMTILPAALGAMQKLSDGTRWLLSRFRCRVDAFLHFIGNHYSVLLTSTLDLKEYLL